jgi:hypothetical protein
MIKVQALRPTNVSETIRLARWYEAKNWSPKRPPITKDRCTSQREATPPLPSASLSRLRNTPTRRWFASLQSKYGVIFPRTSLKVYQIQKENQLFLSW